MCTYARIAAVAAARAVLATAAVLTIAIAFAGPAARAGEYHVYSCRTPSGGVAPTDGWSEGTHSGEDVTLDTCQEAGGGLIAGMDDGYAHLAHSGTDKASWIFRTPTNEAVVSATLWRAGGTEGGSNQHAYYAAYMESTPGSGEAEAFDTCTAWQPCANEGNENDPFAANNRVVAPESVLPSTYIALDAACGSAIVEYGCPEGKGDPDGYAATIELFGADLVLSQTESPTVSAVAGSLAESPTVSGTSDVAFEASDGGSGVYEVVFKVDGAVVSTVVPETDGGRCHDVGGTTDGLPAFLYTQPCPAALSVDLPFDTRTLADGAHDLLVSVLDAAGNATTVLDRKITVANSATPAGGTGESGSSGNGSNGGGSDGGGAGSGGAGSTTGSTGSGSGATGISTAATAGGPANGESASDVATLTAVWRGHAGERLSGAYGVSRTVEGRLTAPGGAPIADAQIEVSELPAYAGAKAHALPTPRTGAAGRWSLALPRGSSSSELRFAYRSHLDAPAPVATRTLTLSVRAGVQLRIVPHIASADGEIRFGGRLLGGPVPKGGKQLVLEARSPGGRWVEFHVIRGRAGAAGRFRYAYRFHLPGPVRYQFRVLCEAEADYPFATGSSNVVAVYER
jgi:uncharacterized membrane protein YgcG